MFISKYISYFKKLKDTLTYLFFLKKNSLTEANLIFTHLTNQEKVYLYKLAKKVTGNIIEIGSYLGSSTCFFASSLHKNNKIVAIDTWENDSMTEGRKDTYIEFSKNINSFKNRIIPIRGYSYDVFQKVLDMNLEISLLFIDGDHSYKGVKKDWDLYSPLLKHNGIIVMHDIGWAEGVKRVIKEDIKPVCREYSSLPNMFWGILK